MADNTNKTENGGKKTKATIYVAVAVCLIAVAAVSAAIALRGNKGAPEESIPTHSEVEETVTFGDISIPVATEKPEKTKNYTFYIDKIKFDSEESNGVTTLTAKDGSGAKMTVTPVEGTPYEERCAELKEELGEGKKLDIKFENAGFGNNSENAAEVAYCVDDTNGGFVEIRYTVPEGNTEYREEFEIMLTMFKIM